MTATDELRAELTKRDVEYEVDDGNTVRMTHWKAYGEWVIFIEYDTGETQFCTDMRRFTPAQAIAATLGAGTCHDRGNIERFICSECGCRLDLQDDDWEATMWLDDGTATVPRFCPNCGMRVE